MKTATHKIHLGTQSRRHIDCGCCSGEIYTIPSAEPPRHRKATYLRTLRRKVSPDAKVQNLTMPSDARSIILPHALPIQHSVVASCIHVAKPRDPSDEVANVGEQDHRVRKEMLCQVVFC